MSLMQVFPWLGTFMFKQQNNLQISSPSSNELSGMNLLLYYN